MVHWNDNSGKQFSSPGDYTVTVTEQMDATAKQVYQLHKNKVSLAGITNNTGTTILTCTTVSINVTATGGISSHGPNGIKQQNSFSLPGIYIYLQPRA